MDGITRNTSGAHSSEGLPGYSSVNPNTTDNSIPAQQPGELPTELSSPEQKPHYSDWLVIKMGEVSSKIVLGGSKLTKMAVNGTGYIYNKSADLAVKGVDMAGNTINLAQKKLGESLDSMHESLTSDKSKELMKKTGRFALKAAGFLFSSNIREDFYDKLDKKAKGFVSMATSPIKNKMDKFKGFMGK